MNGAKVDGTGTTCTRKLQKSTFYCKSEKMALWIKYHTNTNENEKKVVQILCEHEKRWLTPFFWRSSVRYIANIPLVKFHSLDNVRGLIVTVKPAFRLQEVPDCENDVFKKHMNSNNNHLAGVLVVCWSWHTIQLDVYQDCEDRTRNQHYRFHYNLRIEVTP